MTGLITLLMATLLACAPGGNLIFGGGAINADFDGTIEPSANDVALIRECGNCDCIQDRRLNHAITDDEMNVALRKTVLEGAAEGGWAAQNYIWEQACTNAIAYHNGSDCAVSKAAGDLLDQADLDRLSRVRSDLNITSNNQLRRNVAIGEGYINGIDPGEVIGVSGQRGPGADFPRERIFTTGADGHPQLFDSEVFVLEKMARQLTPQSRGR